MGLFAGGRATVAKLVGLPVQVVGLPVRLVRALDDVSTMARATTVLPVVAERLEAIEDHVVSLDLEVTRMRAAVEEIDARLVGVWDAVDPLAGEFQGVLAAVAPLGTELELVRAAVDRLELPLVDMHTAVAPLGEAAARVGDLTGRLPRSRRRDPGPP